MANVTIFSTPTCHFCARAKALFKEHNIPFTDYNVLEDEAKRAELVEKSGQMGVPVIFIDDQMVIGFDEEKIKSLLHIS